MTNSARITQPANQHPAAYLAVLSMLFWGIAYVPSAWLVDDWPPLMSAAARVGLGGVIILGALVLLRQPLNPGSGWGVVVILAITQSVAFYGATFIGIAHEGAGIAAVLANTDPLFVAVLAAWFLGERLSRRQWAGLLVGLVGAAVVVWDGPLWPPRVSWISMLVVAGALAWAIGTIAVAGKVRRGARPVAIAGWQMLVGGIMLAVLAFMFEAVPSAMGARPWGLAVLVALLGSAIPFTLFYVALQRGDAGKVSAWFFLVPVIGVLTAWPLLGEVPGVQLWVGMALVCAGLWMVLAPARR